MFTCVNSLKETTENIVLPNGLVQSHAYAVTGVKQVRSGIYLKDNATTCSKLK